MKVKGPPDAGCRLEPLVTKNRSLFSGVGDGSLVKSTTLHTNRCERSDDGTSDQHTHHTHINTMLTLRQRPAGRWTDYKRPEEEKGAGTDEEGIYSAPRDGAVETNLTCPLH